MEQRIEFRRFHHVRIAVADLPAAVQSWRELLGWAPELTSATAARFGLDDTYIELVAAGEESDATGIVGVGVIVDDVIEAGVRVEAAGVEISKCDDGSIALDPAAVSGVPLSLHAEEGHTAPTAPGPYRRINHLVVAVADDQAALLSWSRIFGAWPAHAMASGEVAHHVPVGKSWIGLTAAGSNANALSNFVARRGEGVYAFAVIVDDKHAVVADLQSRGARLIGVDMPQTFVHPSTTHGVLLEIAPDWYGTVRG
jgi:catechol 2,3-dioxygenase-like lactoylglutathione lyase family enzyme